jgi:hypothetical protein
MGAFRRGKNGDKDFETMAQMRGDCICVVSFSICVIGERFARAYEDPDPERDREGV